MTAPDPSHQVRRRATLRLLLGAALISTTSVFVKLADVGPTPAAFWRMAFGGAVVSKPMAKKTTLRCGLAAARFTASSGE